ncbi:hypothetical protein BH23ACT10_BH23ACT10_23100 [soil metagenome]
MVATINFTLLGLWWLVIRERTDIGRNHAAGRRMGYVVSLQFLIPGTMSLLAHVALGRLADLRRGRGDRGASGAGDGAATTVVSAADRGVLLCILVFLGVNVAWTVAMAPRPDDQPPAELARPRRPRSRSVV